LNAQVFKLIGKDWMLITAGEEESFNTMTASWGGLGFLWGRPVSFIFVRPQRYTREFVDDSPHYTLSFFDETYRDALNYCGTHSGRDVDKMAQTGLTPVVGETGAVYFSEARLVLECKTLYSQDLVEKSFWEQKICDQAYEAGDYHRMYVGEVMRVLQR
jgi:flavin reductase (DIM6/NTAB) family NADH-FMN oxidoreductase RutF